MLKCHSPHSTAVAVGISAGTDNEVFGHGLPHLSARHEISNRPNSLFHLTAVTQRAGDIVGATFTGKGSQPDSHALRRLKFWVWFQEHTRPTDLQITLVWAGVIGFCGALASIAFRAATSGVHKILTGSPTPGLVETFVGLPAWMRVAVPAFGGLIAGAILQFGTRLHGRVSTSDYMEAVVLGDGKISTRRTVTESLSALFTIASGGSIGREGPLVQLSSVIASGLGRLQRWSTPRLRLLVGCGAAAGIASAYNAPIAGAIFVAEIVLGSMAMEMLGPLIFSSVIATLKVRGFLGADPIYKIPPFQLNRN